MQVLLRYLAIINIVTFTIRGIDKWKAVGQKWRIPENWLLVLTGLGGFIGAIVGMQLFRHKTIKGKFLIWFYGLVLVWIIVVILFILRG